MKKLPIDQKLRSKVKQMTVLLHREIPKIKVKVTVIRKPDSRPIRILTTLDTLLLAQRIFDTDTIHFQESMHMICLSRSNEVTGHYLLSNGATAGVAYDPKIVFTLALGARASGIILMHNHPSDNVLPSKNDEECTRRIKKLGELMELKLIDHMIIGPHLDRFYSFTHESIIYPNGNNVKIKPNELRKTGARA